MPQPPRSSSPGPETPGGGEEQAVGNLTGAYNTRNRDLKFRSFFGDCVPS